MFCTETKSEKEQSHFKILWKINNPRCYIFIGLFLFYWSSLWYLSARVTGLTWWWCLFHRTKLSWLQSCWEVTESSQRNVFIKVRNNCLNFQSCQLQNSNTAKRKHLPAAKKPQQISTTMLEIQKLGVSMNQLTHITSEQNLFHLPNVNFFHLPNSITTYT